MTIDVQSLSIGNYILANGKVVEVINIGNEGVLLVKEVPSKPCKCTTAAEADICSIACNNGEVMAIDWVELDKCEHIPFGEEWATKFNIEKTYINGYTVTKSPFKTSKYQLEYYAETEIDVIGSIELCCITSVAHCQNLFFNLANHKLKIINEHKAAQ